MAEARFHLLPAEDRRDALRVAQEKGACRAFLLEKDVWVVATLRALHDAPFGRDLVFKGGTGTTPSSVRK